MQPALKRVLLVLLLYAGVAASVMITSGDTVRYRLTESEQLGQNIWRQYNCMTCHSLYGLGGHLGPDLTNVASRFDSLYIQRTIRYGRNKMPAYRLEPGEVKALIAFLKRVDRSAVYPPDNFPDNYFGKFKK